MEWHSRNTQYWLRNQPLSILWRALNKYSPKHRSHFSAPLKRSNDKKHDITHQPCYYYVPRCGKTLHWRWGLESGNLMSINITRQLVLVKSLAQASPGQASFCLLWNSGRKPGEMSSDCEPGPALVTISGRRKEKTCLHFTLSYFSWCLKPISFSGAQSGFSSQVCD